MFNRAVVGLFVILVAVALGISGCLNTASYHTAQPVEEGATEAAVALEATTSTGDDALEGTVVTQPRLNVRRGLSEELDLGFTAGTFGFAADLNYQIWRDDNLAVSLSPYQGVAWARGFGEDYDDIDAESQLRLTTLLGVHGNVELSDAAVLTAGMKPGFFYQSHQGFGLTGLSESDTQFNPLIGVSLGLRAELDRLWLFPEFNLVYAGIDEDDQLIPIIGGDEGVMMTFGVGVGF